MTARTVRTPLLVAVVGAALAAAGVVVIVVAATRSAHTASFGWFAYAPLSDTTFVAPGVHLVTTASIVGAVLLVVGLIVLSAWVGYRFGTRRRRPTPDTSASG